MVKGARIDSSREKEEVLSPALKSKIERYIGFWREEYGGTWPAVPVLDSRSLPTASWLERGFDRLRYRSLRAFDQAVLHLYCHAPLGLLRGYRKVKRYRDGTPSGPVKKSVTAAVVKTSSGSSQDSFSLRTIPAAEMSSTGTSNQPVHRGAL